MAQEEFNPTPLQKESIAPLNLSLTEEGQRALLIGLKEILPMRSAIEFSTGSQIHKDGHPGGEFTKLVKENDDFRDLIVKIAQNLGEKLPQDEVQRLGLPETVSSGPSLTEAQNPRPVREIYTSSAQMGEYYAKKGK